MFSHMSSAETQPPQPPRRNRSRRRRNRGKRAEEEEDEGSPTWHREGLIFFGWGGGGRKLFEPFPGSPPEGLVSC